MPPSNTRYACLFCPVIHSNDSTLGVHLDAQVREYAVRRSAHTTDSFNAFHPQTIIRAVRSLVRGGRNIPWGICEAGCEDWQLIVPINSPQELRDHCLVDRTDLTADWWVAFAKRGLKPSEKAGDPRVGTGWTEPAPGEPEPIAPEVQQQHQHKQEPQPTPPKRKRNPIDPAAVIDLTGSPIKQESPAPAAKRPSAPRKPAKGKGKQSDVVSLCSSDDDDGGPGSWRTPARAIFALGARSHAVGVEGSHMHGPITIGERNLVGCAVPGSVDTTPCPVRTPIQEFDLRLEDVNRTVTVRAADTIADVIGAFATPMPVGLKRMFVGVKGAGAPPAWVGLEPAVWGAQWTEGVWETVKRAGGRQAPIEIVTVEGCWGSAGA